MRSAWKATALRICACFATPRSSHHARVKVLFDRFPPGARYLTLFVRGPRLTLYFYASRAIIR
ncbi:hypothetical protein PsYK624_014220 [Phanerochaete sordida]|uniref:Uncharacterized protein n=1 Tax=Phanerochaete sordida TaxID=48140 RepID=A0A9P3FZA3_9APHY|nr:hypothetical protein PsYK624_014220 [Phanerochaete sordida]